MHWFARNRWLVIAAICAFWTASILVIRIFPRVPFLTYVWTGEPAFEDLMEREGRKTPTRDDFVFLGIDQSTMELPVFLPEEIADNRALQLMTERPFPWSREVWALLLDKLVAAGARVVMFDLIFSPPNEGDAAFRAALDRHRERVVLGADFELANSAASQIAHDFFATPVDESMPGPILHLHALAAALEHDFLTPTPVAALWTNSSATRSWRFGGTSAAAAKWMTRRRVRARR